MFQNYLMECFTQAEYASRCVCFSSQYTQHLKKWDIPFGNHGVHVSQSINIKTIARDCILIMVYIHIMYKFFTFAIICIALCSPIVFSSTDSTFATNQDVKGDIIQHLHLHQNVTVSLLQEKMLRVSFPTTTIIRETLFDELHVIVRL